MGCKLLPWFSMLLIALLQINADAINLHKRQTDSKDSDVDPRLDRCDQQGGLTYGSPAPGMAMIGSMPPRASYDWKTLLL
ncbi:hypothetical protein FFLO_04412 [Filobasidium floriforme]|uniref:Uncharacterized protein n=1 Tax=Filobasidium floriforme TaxID=5210 RepID=A0A8K0JJ11_9TREE|nr:uncharacterized protein HD553DRAFT_346390 [Filobasidium floriforme]KAG7531351.1 hypothetical protein FFLO_04412 [Filobasidium floriforme]KAH8078010.1 hypothetical protein HD553DRAFT_346390 [Filobasidium floriforme]